MNAKIDLRRQARQPKIYLWLLLLSRLSAIEAGTVVINEIHYAPSDRSSGEEFVELHNAGDAPADLSGWFFSEGIEFIFPEGAVLAAGGYLAVAEDPAALRARYGEVPAAGPFTGRLRGDGERLALRNRSGGLEDAVDYQRGFPWPTVGGDPSYSIELVHPSLDNDLGGSWRSANPGITEAATLVPAGAAWRYLKGTAEASAPVSAWRQRGFDDSSWLSGNASFGYGEGFIATDLADMRNGYSSVFLRRTFEVADLAQATSLSLEVQFDDGFIAWVNGAPVARSNVPEGEVPFDGAALSALEDFSFVAFRLPNPSSYLVEGQNVLAIQLFNGSLGNSSDAFIDARLSASASAGAGPTPGAPNAVLSEDAPPQLRQVEHLPSLPVSGNPVRIQVKASDPGGVAWVGLEYQVVDPGGYIRLEDPTYAAGWTALPMRDDGAAPDEIAGDEVFTAVIPGAVQTHRRLVRYRLRAADAGGLEVRAPYADDPQPNFAYFVYDGVPAWRGAVQPGVTPAATFDASAMRLLPVYHLIARESDVLDSQYNSGARGVHFHGTWIYDGAVYDHIEFENRGEFSTYVSGKNKWRIHFQRGHEFRARDHHGRRYRENWRTMNLSALASPWMPANRGMAGLDEGLAFRLYELAGLPSPGTHFFQLRIIDEAVEAHATDQYRGDLWGLYMAIEHPDGRFLDERGLADGNLYKIENGGGVKWHQGATHPTDASDYNGYRNGFNAAQSMAWWRANTDLEAFYTFRAVNQIVNNMDLRDGWNHLQYHDAATNRWVAIPWDLDMLWIPLTHWSGIINVQNCLTQHAALLMESRNRDRELLDLLLDPSQFSQIVDEYAGFANSPGRPATLVDVDQAMWNYHPRTAGGHRGAFYRNPATYDARGGSYTRTLETADHEGFAEYVKDFGISGYGMTQLANRANDAAIPERPTLASIGAPGFPIDDLRFRAGAFADPQGAATFGGMRWRIGEVTAAGAGNPLVPNRYEIEAVWDSGELTSFADSVQAPAAALKIGGRYRARVRMKDNTGRWSRWSAPLEFTAGAPAAPIPAQLWLRITELHYHPPDDEDLEFIELKNIGAEAIDLSEVRFADGIEFRFADGGVTALGAGEHVVVVKNRILFESVYGAGAADVAGEYSGQLDNAGERIALVWGQNAGILEFSYDDLWAPATDGGGHSLVIADAEGAPASWSAPASWRESAEVGGSPGRDDGAPPPGGRQIPGNANQDALLDLSDAIRILIYLFRTDPPPLPCAGELQEGGNLALLDLNGDESVNVADAVALLSYLYRAGPGHALGPACVRIEGCDSVCGR